jgi:apolipoprotein N-acyltransferase
MSSDYSIMLHAMLADRRFWIFYIFACLIVLLWVGLSVMQGVMFFIGLFITLIVLSLSVVFCMMLITDLRNSASLGTGVSLSNQASD